MASEYNEEQKKRRPQPNTTPKLQVARKMRNTQLQTMQEQEWLQTSRALSELSPDKTRPQEKALSRLSFCLRLNA
jgi:hypothetical protein